MLSPTHLRREGEDYEAQILSKAVKAAAGPIFSMSGPRAATTIS